MTERGRSRIRPHCARPRGPDGTAPPARRNLIPAARRPGAVTNRPATGMRNATLLSGSRELLCRNKGIAVPTGPQRQWSAQAGGNCLSGARGTSFSRFRIGPAIDAPARGCAEGRDVTTCRIGKSGRHISLFSGRSSDLPLIRGGCRGGSAPTLRVRAVHDKSSVADTETRPKQILLPSGPQLGPPQPALLPASRTLSLPSNFIQF